MGTYRVEVTFEIDDEALSDLAVKGAVQPPKMPDWWPDEATPRPYSGDMQMELASSALSLDRRHQIFNLLNQRLAVELGTWLDCPIRLTGPGVQVVDLADPDAVPMPHVKEPPGR